MTKRRFILLALLVGLLAFLAAGCGGDDDEAADTGGATTEEGGGGEAVSGSISVLAVWTGAEGEAFQAVLDGFKAENPDVTVSLQVGEGAGDGALDGGRGRQPARHRGPAAAGVHDRLRRARRAEADRVRPREDRGGVLRVVARPRHGRRRALRALLQGGQQVDGLVQRRRLRGRRRRASGRLGRVHRGGRHAQGLRCDALLDRRRGRLDAHRPVREHLPPHRRAGEVRPADEARDPLDGLVGEGRADRDGQGAAGRQRRRRHLERAADRFPDLGDAGVRRPAEGRSGARRRLRRRRDRGRDDRRSRRPASTSTRSRRSAIPGRSWSAAAT